MLGTAAILVVGALGAMRTGVHAQPAPTAAAAVSRGKVVYEAHCVECHGAAGRGDGPASSALVPRPRDFSSGNYKIRSTDTGTVPTDEDLTRSVRQGLFGTAMPGWEGVLSDRDIANVVQFLKSLAPFFASAPPPKVVAAGAGGPGSPASTAHGRQVYERLQCGKCHGTDGRGTGAVATSFEDGWKQPLRSADLTEPWTFHGGPAARDIYLRVRVGMTGTPMPSFADAASDADLWDLATYVVSLARKPVWSMNAQEVAAFYATLDADARAKPVKRGTELVDSMGCAGCHTPLDSNRRALPGLAMAGGMRVRIEPFGDYPTGNLTSDKDTGLGNWTDDDIKRVLTRGILRDGTRLLPYPMDWPSFSTMTPDDLNAIVAYLRTIPPVRNKVPRPSRPFLPVYLWGKFTMLILKQDPPIRFYPGNVGVQEGR